MEMQTAHPIPCDPLQDLRAALATRRLQDAVGQTASNQLFILQAPTTVARVSVCGNQVCEHGERPTNGTANGGEPAAGCCKKLRSFPQGTAHGRCAGCGCRVLLSLLTG